MAAKKTRVDPTIRLNAYRIIEAEVETRAAFGVRRAYKHTDTPSEDHLVECVLAEVMSGLSEILDFGGE